MKHFLTTTACIAALTVPALAQSQTEAGSKSPMEQGMQIEKSLDKAAEATQETASDAVDYTQNKAAQAAEATEATAETAADATAEAATDMAAAAENTAEATAEAASDVGDAIADTTERAVDATVDTARSAAGATATDAENAVESVKATLDGAAMGEAIMMDASFDGELTEMTAPVIDREGWVDHAGGMMSYEELVGAPIYTTGDERIGEIDNVVVNEQGEIVGAVLGVGGFIGLGEKDVMVSFDSLTLKKQAEGDELRAYIDATEEALEALPATSS
jgi:sporulation protein YlmC with PRC-barrel domain